MPQVTTAISMTCGSIPLSESALYSFAGGTTDGEEPESGPIQASDGTLYGVTYSGGASGKGTVFEID